MLYRLQLPGNFEQFEAKTFWKLNQVFLFDHCLFLCFLWIWPSSLFFTIAFLKQWGDRFFLKSRCTLQGYFDERVVYIQEFFQKFIISILLMSEMNNQEKPAKKQHSYTYWVDEKNKSRDLPAEQRPQKVTPPIEAPKKQDGPSPWNDCGTWEEKKVALPQIEQKLKQNITNYLEKKEQNDFTLKGISLEGEVHKIFKRNRWNVMYEIKGSITFNKQDKEGKIKLIDLTDHGDQEYGVKGDQEVKKPLGKRSNQIVLLIEDTIKNQL